MTKAELNRDIKRLGKKFEKNQEEFKITVRELRQRKDSFIELQKQGKRKYCGNLLSKLINELEWKITQAYNDQEDKEKTIIKEFRRLYWADKEIEYMTLNSLKIIMKINYHLRIEKHMFGAYVKV